MISGAARSAGHLIATLAAVTALWTALPHSPLRGSLPTLKAAYELGTLCSRASITRRLDVRCEPTSYPCLAKHAPTPCIPHPLELADTAAPSPTPTVTISPASVQSSTEPPDSRAMPTQIDTPQLPARAGHLAPTTNQLIILEIVFLTLAVTMIVVMAGHRGPPRRQQAHPPIRLTQADC